ncbi:unnamed protein product [Chrysoparadoxa australica]
MANSILDASAVVCPTGIMSQCFDEMGHEYKLAKFCFSNPTDKISTLDEAEVLNGGHKTLPRGEDVTLSIQVAPGEKTFFVEVGSENTVLHVKEALRSHLQNLADQRPAHIPEDLPASSQRMIFCGKELGDSQALRETGITPEVVIQVYVRQALS